MTESPRRSAASAEFGWLVGLCHLASIARMGAVGCSSRPSERHAMRISDAFEKPGQQAPAVKHSTEPETRQQQRRAHSGCATNRSAFQRCFIRSTEPQRRQQQRTTARRRAWYVCDRSSKRSSLRKSIRRQQNRTIVVLASTTFAAAHRRRPRARPARWCTTRLRSASHCKAHALS